MNVSSLFKTIRERLSDVWNSSFFPLQIDSFLTELATQFVEARASTQSFPVYNTFNEMKTAAANGQIPSAVKLVNTEGYASAGDDGGAKYVRVAEGITSALGLTSLQLSYLAAPDADGSWWLLDDPVPHFHQGGALGDPVGADPTTPCGEKINALLAFVAARDGGRTPAVLRSGHRNYRCEVNITFPRWGGIIGPANTGRAYVAPSTNFEGIDALAYQPGLVFDDNRNMRFQDGLYLESVCWRRAGLAVHTTLEGALDAQINFFKYNGLQKIGGGGNARSVTVRNCAAYGWAFGANMNKVPGAHVDGLYGDCNTLLLATSSGESCWFSRIERKPILTQNPVAQAPHILNPSSLSDDGGRLRVNTIEDPIAEGLTDGQRIASDRLPSPYSGLRRTVTNVTTGGFTFEDTVWDPAYSSTSLVGMDFTFAPHTGSGIVSFADDGGFVRVVTRIDFPFKVGHLSLLRTSVPAVEGLWLVKTVHATDDFTLDVPWDAGLLSANLAISELAAMPTARRHSSVVSNWGTTEGFAVGIDDVDGAYIQGRSKGGSGVFTNSVAAKVHWGSNEGGTIGPIDVEDATTRGLVVRKPRSSVWGTPWKSTGTGLQVDMVSRSDFFTAAAIEMTQNGRASYEQIGGAVTMINASTRNSAARILLRDIGYLFHLTGELPFESVLGNAVDDIERTHWDGPAGLNGTTNPKTRRLVSNSFRFDTNQGGTASSLLAMTPTAATFGVPVSAPNIVAPVVLTGTATTSTSIALTTTGTATTGTVSGFSVDVNASLEWVTLSIEAQRTDGATGATMQESAVWAIPICIQRANNASSTTLYRPGGAALTDIAPDVAPGGALSGARIDLSLSTNQLVVDFDVSGVASGKTVAVTATILPYGMPGRAERVRQMTVSSGTQAMTYVDHQDMRVILRGGSISFNAATQGAGFAFTIVNRQGTDWTISGITGASAILDTTGGTPTAIAAGGMALVLVQPDASTGVEVMITGNTV